MTDERWTGFENRCQRMLNRLVEAGILPEVLNAVEKVPRHLFVEEALRSRVYDEITLPIGESVSLLPPYTVARMVELLSGNQSAKGKKLLEIGTGCGYQTAIFSLYGFTETYSIESAQMLHEQAKRNLRAAGVLIPARLICADNQQGLPVVAPFDRIVITQDVAEIPAALLQQLAPDGRLVAPQLIENKRYLWLIEKIGSNYRETCITGFYDMKAESS